MENKTPDYKPELIERHPVIAGLLLGALFYPGIWLFSYLLVSLSEVLNG
jgi:hypothetical protein